MTRQVRSIARTLLLAAAATLTLAATTSVAHATDMSPSNITLTSPAPSQAAASPPEYLRGCTEMIARYSLHLSKLANPFKSEIGSGVRQLLADIQQVRQSAVKFYKSQQATLVQGQTELAPALRVTLEESERELVALFKTEEHSVTVGYALMVEGAKVLPTSGPGADVRLSDMSAISKLLKGFMTQHSAARQQVPWAQWRLGYGETPQPLPAIETDELKSFSDAAAGALAVGRALSQPSDAKTNTAGATAAAAPRPPAVTAAGLPAVKPPTKKQADAAMQSLARSQTAKDRRAEKRRKAEQQEREKRERERWEEFERLQADKKQREAEAAELAAKLKSEHDAQEKADREKWERAAAEGREQEKRAREAEKARKLEQQQLEAAERQRRKDEDEKRKLEEQRKREADEQQRKSAEANAQRNNDAPPTAAAAAPAVPPALAAALQFPLNRDAPEFSLEASLRSQRDYLADQVAQLQNELHQLRLASKSHGPIRAVHGSDI